MDQALLAQETAAIIEILYISALVLPETSQGGMGRNGIGHDLGPHGLATRPEFKHVVESSGD